MSYNDKKIASILLEHCKKVAPRCPTYSDDMQQLLTEVLRLERDHAISRMNIAERIADQINTVGMQVYKYESEGKEKSR